MNKKCPFLAGMSIDNIIQHDDGTGVCAQGGDVDRC